MSNIPNQYHVYIKKPKKYNEAFFTASCKNVNDAGKILSPNTFRVYLWFLQNCSDYHFDLYAKQVMKDLEISQSSYERAIRELKKENFLIYSRTLGCNYEYNFYETPQATVSTDKPSKT